MKKKNIINSEVKKLNISEEIINILENNNVKNIENIWVLKRQNLKDIGLNDSQIKEVVIQMQLMGIDLNRKIY